jgi:hypothetical protein
LRRTQNFDSGRSLVQTELGRVLRSAGATTVPRSAPAQIVRDIQHLVRRRGDPVRPARTPSISEVLRYPSTSPTPVVRRTPRHRRVISDTTEEDIDEEMGEAPDWEEADGPSGVALSSGSSDVAMADSGLPEFPGGQGRDAPSVFSVDDEARSALVLTQGGRSSLAANFNNLGGSSFRVASAGSPSRLASPDGVSGLQERLRDAVSDRSSSVESFHTAMGHRSPVASPPSGRRPLGSTAPLGHSRRVSGLAPSGHVRHPSGSSAAAGSPHGFTALEAVRAWNAAQSNRPPEVYRPHRIQVPFPIRAPRARMTSEQWEALLADRADDDVRL